jgi:CubicO group peptidase (beta-lactamase class C family)
VAGEILERISGRSWSEFVRERVLQPLEMTASVPDVLELDGVENVATPYVEVDGQLQEDKSWALPLTDGWRRYRETIRPSGAICSSANDLAKFAMFQLGPNCRAVLGHWSADRFRVRFVVRFPEDWFVSFVLEENHAVKVTIENVFPRAEIATFTRVN